MFKVPLEIGKRINKLTILGDGVHGILPSGKTKRMVKVRCDCGNICEKRHGDLKNSVSCGKCPRENAYKDITGLVSGRLKVIEYHSRNTNKRGVNWTCKCDCGRTCVYTSSQLTRKSSVNNCGGCASSTKANANYYKEEQLTTSSDGFLGVPVGYANNGRKFIVLLQDHKLTEIEVLVDNYRKGAYYNPNNPRVQGVGYYGQGDYKTKVNHKHTLEYADWRAMLVRCYSGRYPSYEGVTVCEEWHNFQNFAAWARDNGIREDYALDKDILEKGSKIYSPSTCCYVPIDINGFIRRERYNNLPLGVDEVQRPSGTVYRSQGREGGKNMCYGIFNNVKDAFLVYKINKERSAKALAVKYKEDLPSEVINALYNYTVDIGD